MNTADIMETIASQPEDTWTKHRLYDGKGHYCALGWAAQSYGIERERLRYLSIENRDIYDCIAELLGIDAKTFWEMVGANDTAATHTEAIKGIRYVLQEEGYVLQEREKKA